MGNRVVVIVCTAVQKCGQERGAWAKYPKLSSGGSTSGALVETDGEGGWWGWWGVKNKVVAGVCVAIRKCKWERQDWAKTQNRATVAQFQVCRVKRRWAEM